MKYIKRILMYVVLIVTCLVSPISSFADETKDKDITNITIEEYQNNIEHLKPLSAKEMRELFDQKKTFIIYFGRETCPYCRKLSPVLGEFNKKINNSLYYYDTSREDYTDDIKLFLKNELGVTTVPTTLSVVKGDPISGWAGDDATVDELYEKLYNVGESTSSEELNSEIKNPTIGDSEKDANKKEYILIGLGVVNLLTSILIIILLIFRKDKKS